MAYGLQVFDSSGNLEVDVSSRLSRYMGTIVFQENGPEDTSYPPNSQNINFTGITNDGSWFIGNLPGSFGAEIHTGYITIYSSYLAYVEGYYDPSARIIRLDVFRF